MAQGVWKPLIVCPHADLSQRVQFAFEELGIAVAGCLAEYPRMGAISGVVEQHRANLCLLDVASQAEHALPLIGEACTAAPVVALNTRSDADLILRCLRRGASEFLGEPTTEQLRVVLERLRRLRAPAEPSKPSSLVYCVMPGKPGCGASTLAVHLPLELKRSGASRALLVDTDVHAGAVAFLLKLKPEYHLGDAVRERQRMDSDLWGRLAVSCYGINLLLAPENPAAPVEIDRQVAGELIAFWRSHYEAIVLDTAGAQPAAVEFARLADVVLVVTTNELAALHAARRTIECLEQSGVERSRLRLVVNRYTPSTGLKREEVETALKMAPFALLANDYDLLQQAVLDGRPAPETSRFGRSVHALVERLEGKEPPPRKRAGFFGLLPQR